jgi:hypothetical protein
VKPTFPVALASLCLAAACGSKPSPATLTTAAPSAQASAAPVAAAPPASAPAASSGPVVTIPAGKLVAGTACGDHPRLPNEELGGASIDMGEFSIDAYPYPNDPSKPAQTSIARDEAAALCQARGRRLCTDLEWERACKGPKNTRYEYGDRFDVKKCSSTQGTTPNGGPVGALDGCASAFGVHSMHGFAFEWTSSAWERDSDDKGSAVVRGGYGDQPFAHLRCAAVRAAPPAQADARIGFRCCGGPEGTAKVQIDHDERPALEPVDPLDPALAARVQSAMRNGKLKADDGSEYTVEKAWRWHPVGHEDLVLARVTAPGDAGAGATLAVVAELCERVAQLSNRSKTPASELGEPVAKDEARPRAAAGEPPRHLVIFPVKRGEAAGEIRIEYQFGQAVITEKP